MDSKRFLFMIFLIALLTAGVMAADYSEDLYLTRKHRLEFGHILEIKTIGTDPTTIVPGKPAALNIKIENTGTRFVNDVRIELILPDEIGFLEDVSKRKISRLDAEEENEIRFALVCPSTTHEGIYDAYLIVDYVNHIGDERQDTYNLSLIVKYEDDPKMFALVEETEIYQSNLMGEVTVKFVNNDVSDIKFLTVELKDTEDYEILSPYKQYIGDLDSDDFESIDFKLRVSKESGEVVLPLKMGYKDVKNNYFEEEKNVILKLRTAEDLGVTNNHTLKYSIVAIAILLVFYYFYRRYRKKRFRKEKY
jgi:hypothetical protein